jgi:hypothetical protein
MSGETMSVGKLLIDFGKEKVFEDWKREDS